MNGSKLVAIALIVGGVLALLYGGFTYPRETHQATIGPINVSVHEDKTITVPVWVGIGAIVIGGVLLAAGGRRG